MGLIIFLDVARNPNVGGVNCDIEVHCVVLREMLWFSAPISLNNDLLNDGVLFKNIMQQSTRLSKVLLLSLIGG